jgi:hypothetical protein
MQTTVSLTEVLANIKNANNGYVFATSLSPEYLRRTEQLVKRGVVVKSSGYSAFSNTVETMFFTVESFKAHSSRPELPAHNFDNIDYEAKLLFSTENYLATC